VGDAAVRSGQLAARLETDRLVLEPWGERHREPWRAMCRDPEVMRYIGGGEVFGRERADERFDRAIAQWQQLGFGRRAVIERQGGAWLGFTSLSHVGPEAIEVPADEIEIGWWIVRDAWGRGYASEAGAATRDEAFARIGLDRIIARTQRGNAASVRVAGKIGLQLEREARGRHGEPVLIYVLTRAQWMRQRGTWLDSP
jgi:RimJ/RimL family protein N-acetyltransferase